MGILHAFFTRHPIRRIAPVLGLCLASLLTLFTVSAVGASARVHEKSLDDYWRELTLPFARFEAELTVPKCYADSRHLRACLEGLNAALGMLQPPVSLTPDPVPAGAKVRQDFGALKAIEGSVSPLAGTDVLFRLGPTKLDLPAVTRWVRATAVTPETESSVAAAAINAYLAFVADPHTRIVPARYLEDQRRHNVRRFIGVGLNLKRGKQTVWVGSVLPDSPAEQAGLLPGDVLTAIDGEPIGASLSLEEATRRLEGAEGTFVTLQVRRRQQALSFRLARRKLLWRALSARLVTRETRKWGYLRLQDLAHRRGCEQMREIVMKLSSEGAKGFILDLRDNPGGLVTEAVCVANLFLGPGKRVVAVQALAPAGQAGLVGKGDTQRQAWSTSEPQTSAAPLVVLVNAATASAAEIVAGALQDYTRAWVVGVRTFGKGSVQDVTPWPQAKGIDYLFTVARFFLPSGRAIQQVGVFPDWEVFSQRQPTEEDLAESREEDRYPSALPAEMGPPPPAPKPVPAPLQTCVKTSGLADKKVESGGDYPLLVAEDLIACTIEP